MKPALENAMFNGRKGLQNDAFLACVECKHPVESGARWCWNCGIYKPHKAKTGSAKFLEKLSVFLLVLGLILFVLTGFLVSLKVDVPTVFTGFSSIVVFVLFWILIHIKPRPRRYNKKCIKGYGRYIKLCMNDVDANQQKIEALLKYIVDIKSDDLKKQFYDVVKKSLALLVVQRKDYMRRLIELDALRWKYSLESLVRSSANQHSEVEVIENLKQLRLEGIQISKRCKALNMDDLVEAIDDAVKSIDVSIERSVINALTRTTAELHGSSEAGGTLWNERDGVKVEVLSAILESKTSSMEDELYQLQRQHERIGLELEDLIHRVEAA